MDDNDEDKVDEASPEDEYDKNWYIHKIIIYFNY